MRKFLKDRKLNKLRKLNHTKPYNGLKESKRALIVSSGKDMGQPQLNVLIERMLKKHDLDVVSIGYIESKLPKNEDPIDGYYYKNQLDWRGLPKAKNVQDLTKQEFDVLIDLTEELDHPNNVILLTVKSGLKVGVVNQKQDYDLVVTKRDFNDKQIVEELEHFLNNISKS